jgi:DNA polymerase elongation subunit (family B)
MFDGNYDIKYFLLSKTLKPSDSYKKPESIAHVYLANKIKKDDPGNAPQSGDRMDFAYIKAPKKSDGSKLLQGEMIEMPRNIIDKKLEIDYLFYLTNQIKNPALQFLELVDKNAEQIFNEFIEKYSPLKIKKEKIIKLVKEKKEKPIERIKKLYKEINDYVNLKKWGNIETFDFDNIIKNIRKSKEIEL